jgi:hypothetical protein
MPSSFTIDLDARLLADGKWRLLAGFTYAFGHEDSPVRVEIPAGFVTDFASVPKVLQGLIGSVETHGKAAVLHDYLYATQPVSRIVADAVFLEAMAVLGVPRWKRWAMYRAVRCFGWWPWNKHRKKLARKP